MIVIDPGIMHRDDIVDAPGCHLPRLQNVDVGSVRAASAPPDNENRNSTSRSASRRPLIISVLNPGSVRAVGETEGRCGAAWAKTSADSKSRTARNELRRTEALL